jgi:hypothetical protein
MGIFNRSKSQAPNNDEIEAATGKQPEETENKVKEKPDYRVAWLSVLGVTGFIFGCVILFYPDFSNIKLHDLKFFQRNIRHSVFHEIDYQPRKITKNVIEHSISLLNDAITNWKNEEKSLDSSIEDPKTKPDKKTYQERKMFLIDSINKDTAKIVTLSQYQAYYEESNETDTFAFQKLNNALHFNITPGLIYKWDSTFSSKITVLEPAVSYFFKFKNEKTLFSDSGTLAFNIHTYNSDVQFISKYPASGIWVLLVLVFCSFSLIAISNCIHLNHKIVFDDNHIEIASEKQYFFITGITFLVLLALASLWNLTFYDEEIVKNIYFLSTLSVTVKVIFFLGYATGAFCLAGFIYNAAMLTYVSKNIKSKKGEFLKKQATLDTDKTNVNLQQEIETIKSDIADRKIAFKNLLKYFNNYFTLSAIILSLMVLLTGALFSTVNSLDFIKLLEDDWGYSPVRSDLVYLYAGLHSVILLLIYIPAKIRFNEIKTLFDEINPGSENGGTDAPNGSSEQTKGKWYDFLKDPFNALKGTLLAVSPLLASLVQSLLNMLFN